MKKIYQISLALVLVLAMVNTGKSQGFQLGVKGLANLSSLNGLDDNYSSVDKLKGKFTLGVGLYATLKFSKLGVQPEILYMRQGARFTDASNTEWNQKMTYLTIPVMVNFYLIKNLYVQAGPYFGILMAAEQKLTNDPLGLGYPAQDNKDAFKSSDIGIAAGVGVEVKKLTLSARYMLGLTDITDFTGATSKMKNGTFQIGIGFSFIKKG